jgi:hypothetical protein
MAPWQDFEHEQCEYLEGVSTMSSKSGEPPKGPEKPATDQAGAKKPTPMLDLKATEVKETKPAAATAPGDTKGAAGKPDPAAKSPGSPPPKADDKNLAKPAATAASPAKPTGSGPAAPDPKVGPASSGKPTSTAGSAASGGGSSRVGAGAKGLAGSAPSPSAEKRSGGGMGATFTHLLAAVIGGVVVLFGAAPLENQLGLKMLPPAEIPAEISNRLAALERATAKNPAADFAALGGEVDALKKRVDELAAGSERIATLAEEQNKLAETVAALEARPGTGAPANNDLATALNQRVAKLEETLKTLAGATGPDGDKNALAKLATVAGKLTDLERTVNNQLEALRKSVMTELENRVAKTAEASAAAQAGTERIDRELAVVKTNAARLAQRAETLKAANDRLAALVRAAQEQTAHIQAELDGLKGDVLQQFKKVARPQDVTSAIAPITSQLAKLDTRLQTIVGREEVRKANAKRIVLALELGNLKRALDRGGAYAAELAAVRKVSADSVDLGALEKFQSTGVPTAGGLATEFRTLAFKAINAEDRKSDGSVIDRLVSGAKSIVRVRRTKFAADDTSTEAIVARIEARLRQGDVTGALAQAKALSKEARAPIADWLDRLAARADVDHAIAGLEAQLKASLGGGSAAPAKPGTKG